MVRILALIVCLLLGALAGTWIERRSANARPPAEFQPAVVPEARITRIEKRLAQLADRMAEPRQPESIDSPSAGWTEQLDSLQRRLTQLELADQAVAQPPPAITEGEVERLLVSRGEQWFLQAPPGSNARQSMLEQRFSKLQDQVQLGSLECRSHVCRIRYNAQDLDSDEMLKELLAGEANFNTIHSQDSMGEQLLYVDFNPPSAE